jgi:hypothetical protein
MQSQAATVPHYLSELPAERRAAIEAVRAVILANLDKQGLEEGMQYGMIGYYVPHRVFPQGYHCDPRQPLPYAGLATQKQHMSIYLMFAYGDAAHEQWLRSAWARAGKKLDMGKACIRFKRLEDLALDVLGEAIRRVPASAYIARYEAILQSGAKAKAKAKAATKTTAKTTAKPATKTTAKTTAKPATKTAAKTTAKPTTKSTAKPTTKSTAKPATKPSAKPTTKPSAKPATKPSTKSTTKKSAPKSTTKKSAKRP